ncbi:zinc transporter ZIP10 [Melitaea cinxia]|uniref:zinc transporter ZIP10 n=1 Tax=Melitaea cinxia TaxID=113334 RepID=UPI001E273A53|nr:zinc transporter ZIP10 [Melitaea cinxia]
MLTSCAVVLLAVDALCAASLQTVDIDLNNTLPAEQYFIDKIFDKYGDKGVITFEGFEHLLDSLGLGGRVFNSPHDIALHRVNGSFRQLHDTQHRHRRSPSSFAPILKKSCLSPKEILEVYGMENEPGVITINPKTFLEMCPALVYQLDQRSCYKTDAPTPKLERVWTWVYASLSILIISATGLLGVAIVPMLKSVIFSHVIHFLVAVAVGTLCGDALLHLLPHALKSNGFPNEPQEETEVVLKCSVTFLTILIFYSVEAIMQTINGGHSHSHDVPNKTLEELKVESTKQIEPIELGAMMPGSPPPPVERPMTSTALMVIVGDGLHNLTDGLAIGAAFSGDPVTGFATALAVFCHELPHELGDFAVLLRSGMSIKRALYYNLLSSALSFMGMAGGIWLAEDHESASQWIYAATAGTFFYIALADLVPEINENNKGKSVHLVLAILGFLTGGIIMLLIALHEDSIQYLFRNSEQ